MSPLKSKLRTGFCATLCRLCFAKALTTERPTQHRGKIAVVAAIVVLLGSVVAAQTDVCSNANSLFREHRWAEAAQAFASCEQSAPGRTDALLYRGKALVNGNQFSAAAESLESYAASHPQSDDVLYLLGYVRFRLDHPKESLETFAKAAKLKPPNASDLKIAALDYVLLDDYNSAARYLEESLRLNPGDLEARYHLGRVRYQLNQFDLAIAAFEEVLKVDPSDVKAQTNLGLCLEGKNQLDAALAAYHRAIALDSAAAAHSGQPYLDLGKLLLTMNRNGEAVSWLQKAETISPDSSETHYQLGRAQLSLGQLDLARAQFEQAIRLNPEDGPPHYLLGRVYRRLGKADEAAEQFKITEELIRNQNAKSGGMASGRR